MNPPPNPPENPPPNPHAPSCLLHSQPGGKKRPRLETGQPSDFPDRGSFSESRRGGFRKGWANRKGHQLLDLQGLCETNCTQIWEPKGQPPILGVQIPKTGTPSWATPNPKFCSPCQSRFGLNRSRPKRFEALGRSLPSHWIVGTQDGKYKPP